MEEVKARYKLMQQALLTLHQGLEQLEKFKDKNKEIHTLMRDGVVQRFEYCTDSFWKFLKLYLENVKTASIALPSPREILKLAFHHDIIDNHEYKILLDCVSDRNLTSHTYNEELAEAIYTHIPLYFFTMQKMINRLNIDEDKRN